MMTRKMFKRIISWILIVILMIPNIAFTAELSNLTYIRAILPNDTEVGNQLNNLTLYLFSDPEGLTEPITYDIHQEGILNVTDEIFSKRLLSTVYYARISTTDLSFNLKDSDLYIIDLNYDFQDNQQHLFDIKFNTLPAPLPVESTIEPSIEPSIELDTTINPTQISGHVTYEDFSPLLNGDFWVEVRDAQGNHMKGVESISSDGTNMIFSTGSLPPGDYQLVAHPSYYDADLGITSSEPFLFTIDENGNSNIIDAALNFKTIATTPLTYRYYDTEYKPNFINDLYFGVELINTAATSELDFTFSLLTKVGDVVTSTQPLDANNFIEFTDLEGESAYLSVNFVMDPNSLMSEQEYFLRIHDGTKYADLRFIATAKDVIFGTEYIGSSGTVHYYAVSGYAKPTDSYANAHALEIYNAANQSIGSGSIYFDIPSNKTILSADFPISETPAYFTIVSNDAVFGLSDSHQLDLTHQTREVMWIISETDDGESLKINILSDFVNQSNLSDFEIITWRNGTREVIFPVADASEYTVGNYVGTMMGVTVTVPKTAITTHGEYNLEFKVNGESSNPATLYFPNYNDVNITGKLYAPGGTEQVMNYIVGDVFTTPGANYTLDVNDGIFHFSTNDDGDYKFTLFSKEQNTYAISQILTIKVIDGVANWRKIPAENIPFEPIPSEITVVLQEGVYFGKVLDQDGMPTSTLGSLGHHQIFEDGTWVWLGGSRAKPDGSIYVPKVDGHYLITYGPWPEYTTLVGEEVFYDVVDGEVVGPQDLHTWDIQITGQVLLAPNLPVLTPGLDVSLYDGDGKYLRTIPVLVDEAGATFAIYGLTEGYYEISATPSTYYLDQGYSATERVRFHVDAYGNVSHSIITLTLPLKQTQLDYSTLNMIIAIAQTISTVGMTPESAAMLEGNLEVAMNYSAFTTQDQVIAAAEVLYYNFMQLEIVKPDLVASTTESTNRDIEIAVNVAFTPNEDAYTLWAKNLLEDTWTLLNLKAFTVSTNGTYQVKAVYDNGYFYLESLLESVTITNIDKSLTGTVVYSTNAPTNKYVTATLIVNEDVQMLSGSKYVVFYENGTHTFEYKDVSGIYRTVVAKVTNIDKTAPTLLNAYTAINGVASSQAKGNDLLSVQITVNGYETSNARLEISPWMTTELVPTHNLERTMTSYLYEQSVPTQINGDMPVRLILKDAVGNTSTPITIGILAVDNTPPTFNVNLLNQFPNGFITETQIKVYYQKFESDVWFKDTEADFEDSIENFESYINQGRFNDGQPHSFIFNAVDEVGNRAIQQTITFVWDSNPPAAPVLSNRTGEITAQNSVTLQGTADAGLLTIERVTELGSETLYTGEATKLSTGIVCDLIPGINVLNVWVTDAVGNASSKASIQVTSDVQEPIIQITREASQLRIVTNEVLQNVVFTINDKVIQEPLTFLDNTATYAWSSPEGVRIVVTGTDSAGNKGIGRLTLIDVPSVISEGIKLSDGITLEGGGFSDASELIVTSANELNDASYNYIGGLLNFELSNGAVVSPVTGVVVDIDLGLGHPDTSKLSYYDEVLSSWEPLYANELHGDSLYNSTNESINVAIDASQKAAITVDASGQHSIAPGHILALLRHFSGYSVIQDIMPPEIWILTEPLTVPVNKLIDTYDLKVSLSEPSKLTVNGVTESETKAKGVYTYTMDLIEGENTFTVMGTDLNGLTSNTDSYTVFKDIEFEDLDASVVGNSVVPQATVTIAIVAKDANFQSVRINDTSYTTKSFNAKVELLEGTNVFVVEAVDLAGNKKSEIVTVTKDTTGPEMDIRGVSNGAIVNSNLEVSIVGTDLENYSWQLTSATDSAYGVNEPMNYSFADSMSRDYVLIITGYDAVGNKTEQVIHFTVMQEAPSIVISPVVGLSNQDQEVSVTVAPSDAFVEIEIYKNGVRVLGSVVNPFTTRVSDEGMYEMRVRASKGFAVANQEVHFEIDKTAPTIKVDGVIPEQLCKEAVTINYMIDDSNLWPNISVEAKLTKNSEVPILIPSSYTVVASGLYTLEVKAEDSAGNTRAIVIEFTVEIPIDEEPDNPNAPKVDLASVETQTQTIDDELKLVNFASLNVSLNFDKVEGLVDSELTLERYEPSTPNDIMSIVTKKDTIHKLTSDIYKMSTYQSLNSEVTINLLYDASLLGKENKLEIACYDEVKDNWILIKGKFDKATKTVSFKTNVLSYFMIVESIKNK